MDKSSMITETDAAYLAGFIDADGSIGIHKEKDKRKSPTYYTYRASIQITNTDILLNDIANTLNEKTIVYHKKTATQRAGYLINIRNQIKIKSLLEQLIPYLLLKRLQARLVLEFVESRINNKGRGRHKPYTQNEIMIHHVLKIINSRGNEKEKNAEMINKWKNNNKNRN